MSLPPDDQAARRNWQGQAAPLARPLGSRDPGIVVVDSVQDVAAIVERESQGEQVATFRQRTTENLLDPVAQLQRAIRAWVAGMDEVTFRQRHVLDTEGLALALILYGDMADDKKAQHLNKLSKLALDRQKEVLRQNNIALAREERELRNQVELTAKLRKFRERSIAAQEVKDGGAK